MITVTPINKKNPINQTEFNAVQHIAQDISKQRYY